jgi:hypothetical protein
MDMDGDSLD